MEKFEINIKLIPYKDGIHEIIKETDKSELKGFVIGTNGKSRTVECKEADDIIIKLSDDRCGEYMGTSKYLLIHDKRSIVLVEGRRYFVGSALVLVREKKHLRGLSVDEIKEASKLFESRLVTLCAQDLTFSAYEFN